MDMIIFSQSRRNELNSDETERDAVCGQDLKNIFTELESFTQVFSLGCTF